jgi:hypothetical protein
MLKMTGPKYPENGNLRMYNMFPFRAYGNKPGIQGMSEYVPEVASMGFNAAWINPLQAPGTKTQPHPDGIHTVSGSLYAMADELEFNPLIFPNCSTATECIDALKAWTASVRLENMYPLFDLVLNHVGLHESTLTPLQTKLANMGLLLAEVNSRWPDIQGLDYYRSGSSKRGITTEPKDLDEKKIDKIFEILWEPMIRRYIEYGFMGARVDAITHVPVPVQQRAFRLIEKLVFEKYGTRSIIVGELMISNPESLVGALSACGYTHCIHPSSFFWSPNHEGGYDSESSQFAMQSERLASIVHTNSNFDFRVQLLINKKGLNLQEKLQANTCYLFCQNGVWFIAVNEHPTDICFGVSPVIPVTSLAEASEIFEALECMDTVDSQLKRKAKAHIHNVLLNSSTFRTLHSKSRPISPSNGGLIATLGNHDVGTLLAKVTLDFAYEITLKRLPESGNKADLDSKYKEFKNKIKGIEGLSQLLLELKESFCLSAQDISIIRSHLNGRIREKIFIQANLCLGGWYILAGDEVGICHKPEVFEQFGSNPEKLGTPLIKAKGTPYDLGGFIRGVNLTLSLLPPADGLDTATPYCVNLNLDFGKDIKIFMIVRTDHKNAQQYLLVHCSETIPINLLEEEIMKFINTFPSSKASWKIMVLEQDGDVIQSKVVKETLVPDSGYVVSGVLPHFSIFSTGLTTIFEEEEDVFSPHYS